jgi:hypothetical protein
MMQMILSLSLIALSICLFAVVHDLKKQNTYH